MSTEKVAIVTAGGSGMGAAAARKLAADGYRVAILSSSGKGESLAQQLGGLGVTGSNPPATARKARCWKSAMTTGIWAWSSIC
ncbi:hypothetical protein G6F31_021370 [Rhizopus arrhizus]|nr:hypothetical protein G6F31_021370 [Rhizopus arrhizus]